MEHTKELRDAIGAVHTHGHESRFRSQPGAVLSRKPLLDKIGLTEPEILSAQKLDDALVLIGTSLKGLTALGLVRFLTNMGLGFKDGDYSSTSGVIGSALERVLPSENAGVSDAKAVLQYVISTEEEDFDNWVADEGRDENHELFHGDHVYARAVRAFAELFPGQEPK